MSSFATRFGWHRFRSGSPMRKITVIHLQNFHVLFTDFQFISKQEEDKQNDKQTNEASEKSLLLAPIYIFNSDGLTCLIVGLVHVPFCYNISTNSVKFGQLLVKLE